MDRAVRRGRPRSDQSRQRILAATREILSRTGAGGLTMDAIAATAQVSKQTLYRWWPSRAEIIVDAVLDGYEPPVPATISPTPDRDADILHWIELSIASLSNGDTASSIRAVTGAIAGNPGAARRYSATTLNPGREALAGLLTGSPRGAAPESSDAALATADIAIGALMFWTLIDTPPNDAHRRELARLLSGYADPAS